MLIFTEKGGGIVEEVKKCPECGGDMEEGFVVDHTYGGAVSSKWATYVKAFGIFTKMGNSKSIITYRCTKCGFLKSYAR